MAIEISIQNRFFKLKSNNAEIYIYFIFHISIFYTLRPFSNAKNLNLQTKLSTLIRDIAKKIS